MGVSGVAQRVYSWGMEEGNGETTRAEGAAVQTPAHTSRFESIFGRAPALVSRAPGRVNLIGEHTDYNGGFVLPAAIDRGVTVLAAPRVDRKLLACSEQFEARDEWPVDAPRRTGRKEWRDYVRGVAWALLDSGLDLRGADLLIDGDVPPGAGLSSSAALELAVAGALCSVAGIEVEPARLAMLCRKAENDFVGVPCGIMDQLASALGRPGCALLIDCRSLEMEPVRLPLEERGVALVVIDSNVPRRLADTPYGERLRECADAAQALGLSSLREATLESAAGLPDPLARRVRHVVSENQRVLDAVEALRSGDLARLGELMCGSHRSLRDDFEVSCPELDLLVRLASGCAGVLGARLTGAGFGGCTVNLLSSEVEPFMATVLEAYREQTGLDAHAYVCRAAGGLRVTNV
jgi:galactokinase